MCKCYALHLDALKADLSMITGHVYSTWSAINFEFTMYYNMITVRLNMNSLCVSVSIIGNMI